MALEKIAVRKPLTQERLRAVLDYDPVSGVFTYRIRVARCVRVGDVAGCVNGEGYRHIRVDGHTYKAHRLAILYVTGEWPVGMTDHRDGQRDHNAFRNLRPATRSENLANSAMTRRGKSARKGVSFNKQSGRWIARIQRDHRSHFLGYFNTESEAGAAYDTAAQALFGSYARKDAA